MGAKFLVGDVFDRLADLEAASVDLVMTSPPFLALRSYLPADHPDKSREIGSESDPGAFVDVLCSVVEALSRVLAPHGSIVFELGDTYAGSGGAGEGQPKFQQRNDGGQYGNYPQGGMKYNLDTRPVKGAGTWPRAKSLALVPELFRITLAYGTNPLTGKLWWEHGERWMVRNVVRWVKPNPPVGALGDKFRPATTDLVVFTRSAKRFFDLDAVQTINNPTRMDEIGTASPYMETRHDRGEGGKPTNASQNPAGAPPLDWWNGLSERIDVAIRAAASGGYDQDSLFDDDGERKEARETPGRQIIRESATAGEIDLGDVFNVVGKGYSGAHYAVYPPALVVPFVKSMCPEQVCRQCGEPSRRITGATEYVQTPDRPLRSDEARRYGSLDGKRHNDHRATTRETLGFSDCGHDDWRPGMVLDPFAGTGVTLAVATGHGRDSIGIDLDPTNADLALERVGPLLLEVDA